MNNSRMETAVGKLGRVVVVRLKPGADVLAGLAEACEEYGISNGVIMSAIGSLKDVQFCDVVELPTKAGFGYGEILHLTGPIELVSASGIICHDDEGVRNLHVHVTLTDRYGNAHGGHLADGTQVLLTLDAVIGEIEDVNMLRKFNEELEVPLLAPQQM